MTKIEIVPDDLNSRPACSSVPLLDADGVRAIDPAGVVEDILWGWKRDSERPNLTRVVFFSARHVVTPLDSRIDAPFFFYCHYGDADAMEPVLRQVDGPSPRGELAQHARIEVLRQVSHTAMLRIVTGCPTTEVLHILRRLSSRQPDHPRQTPPTLPTSERFDLRESDITGCDLLAGSGLSYESELPMLKEVHDLFWVDDGYDGFCLGRRDQLPTLFCADVEGTFRRFASWHVQAATASPSVAHLALLKLQRSGFLNHVFTDNVDRLLHVAGFEDVVRVRGCGVVNDVYPVEFHPRSNALLVVGVSADRRGIIAQARARGLKVVVVNPYLPVSPGAKNLDYLLPGDIYYRMTAREALPRIVAATVGGTG